MFQPPPLGVGMVYFPALAPFYADCGGLLDVLEVEPQTLWHSGVAAHTLLEAAFASLLRSPQRKLVHGVGMPLAASVDPDARQFAPWRESIERLQAPWASEHLAFQRVPQAGGGSAHSGFLLPPLQSQAVVHLAAQRIRALQQRSGVPIAFENGPNYLRPQPGELPDGTFYAQVAEQADCGMVLDLHNLWCNQRNGRQSMQAALQQLPLERVWEVHVAGGELHDGYWLDAHSGLVPPEVMAACAEWLPRLPNLGALVFEIMPDYVQARQIGWDLLAGQLEALQTLWRTRGSAVLAAAVTTFPPESPVALSPAAWEQTLGALVNGRTPEPPASALAQDPGVPVLRHLVESFRAGTLAEGLALSYRLLVLTLGDAATNALMAEFWRGHWPQPFVSDELQAFQAFVHAHSTARQVAHLLQVLDYECRCVRAQQTGLEDWAPFDCDPLALLGALARGTLPPEPAQGAFELQISPG